MSRRTKFANQSSDSSPKELSVLRKPPGRVPARPRPKWLAHLLGMTQQVCGAEWFEPRTFGRASPGRDGAAEGHPLTRAG